MATGKPSHSGPVRERAKDELRECQTLVQNLFEAHGQLLRGQAIGIGKDKDAKGTSARSPEAAPEPVQIMDKLVAQQRSLRKLIDDGKHLKYQIRLQKPVTDVRGLTLEWDIFSEVLEHQRLNGIIEELLKANTVEDAKIAHLGANLRAAESVLQNALDDARPRVAALKRANKRPVDVDEVISYGSKISASLSAPSGWDPSQPLGNHLPPAPTDEMMRAGKLATLSLEEETKLAEGDKPTKS